MIAATAHRGDRAVVPIASAALAHAPGSAEDDAPAAGAHAAASPPPWLRGAVRDVLEQSSGFQRLSPLEQRSLAQAMVKVSATAAALIAHERAAQHEIESALPPHAQGTPPARLAGDGRPPLARAQSQPEFGESANRMAGVTQSVLNAVSFPRFVTDLINGVFKAMLDSSSQQMQTFVELLNNVSASLDGFERTQFSTGHVRQWVADRFPDQIEYDLPELEPGEQPDLEEIEAIRLRLRGNASMPGEPELRATLGLEPEEPLTAANPEALVPLARRQIARQRQQMLATMVMMGMQRIVIDSGKINASMRFHIDTRSAANQDRGSQFGMTNRIKAGGGVKVGPWGASAEVENTVSYVSTERNQRTEEINTELDLNSSVEINFRTDYLPLNRMAPQGQAERIRGATLNPAAETAESAAVAARQHRTDAQRTAERERATSVQSAINPGPNPPTTQIAAQPAAAAGSGTSAGAGAGADAGRGARSGGGTAPGAGGGAAPGAGAGTGTRTGVSAGALPGATPGAGAGAGSGATAGGTSGSPLGAAAGSAPSAGAGPGPGATPPGGVAAGPRAGSGTAARAPGT